VPEPPGPTGAVMVVFVDFWNPRACAFPFVPCGGGGPLCVSGSGYPRFLEDIPPGFVVIRVWDPPSFCGS
jgi:hypothetical protein